MQEKNKKLVPELDALKLRYSLLPFSLVKTAESWLTVDERIMTSCVLGTVSERLGTKWQLTVFLSCRGGR